MSDGAVCPAGVPRDQCAFSAERIVKRKVKVKGRWVRRGPRPKPMRDARRHRIYKPRFDYKPWRFQRYKTPRTVVKTMREWVDCRAKRIGGADGFKHVCAKHAKVLAAQRVTEARSALSKLARAAAKARVDLKDAKAQQAELLKRLKKGSRR